MIKIAFVCTGNTCRSPMCEIIFKKLLKNNGIKGYKISSCGISVTENAINPLALSVLNKLGFKVGRFSPKQADSNYIASLNAVICMTENQKTKLSNFDNVFSIGELTGLGDIPDPFGQSEEIYLDVAKKILQSLEILLKILVEDNNMKIAVASDHAGFKSKEHVKDFLINRGYTVVDYGTNSEMSCDYPDIALPLANAVASQECDRGIIICGTGIGVSICVNKVNGIRCGLCNDAFSCELSRRHNNANVLAMGARIIDVDVMENLVTIFLETQFEGGRHQNRIDKIAKIEELQKNK